MDDLASVVDAAKLDQFDLVRVSQGCSVAIGYSVRNAGRVRRMGLYGGYPWGWRVRASPLRRRTRCGCRRPSASSTCEDLAQVNVPTLVLHADQDALVSFAAGKMLASTIPGAQFVQLDSRNHLILEHEPAWARAAEAIRSFLTAHG